MVACHFLPTLYFLTTRPRWAAGRFETTPVLSSSGDVRIAFDQIFVVGALSLKKIG